MPLNAAYGDGFAGVANYAELNSVFLVGDLTTEGSVRFIYDDAGVIIRGERLVSGTWIVLPLDASGGLDVSTWIVDDDLGEFVLDETGDLVIEGP